jgi:demethylphylloquinone reductase
MTQFSDRICILGGGFGGLYTALKLDQLPWDSNRKPEIVLVDRHDRFLFSPLLYELMTGELQTWEIAPPFVELLQGTDVRFCQAAVTNIDVGDRQVQLSDGQTLDYDRLILALGGETPMSMVPGAAEYALPFRTISDAYRLQERLKVLEASDLDRIRIAIVGAGYSGVELACKLADRLGDRGRLRLIDVADTLLRTSTEFNRDAAKQALEERGVWLDLETAVQSIGAETLTLDYKGKIDELAVELVLWTVGTQIAQTIRELPLPHSDRGQITVTSTLQAIDRPEIFALGDLADCRDADGQKVPATAQVALQQAEYTAWNVWASLSDRPLLPFRYFNFGEMMTLGIDNATLTGLGIKLDGQLAHIARRIAYLYRLPTWEHQLKVGLNWIGQPLREVMGMGNR